MKKLSAPQLASSTASLAMAMALGLSSFPAGSATALADDPLFATIKAPANLVLTPSVEWPTASTPAYLSTSAYDPTATYYGYFDADKCYVYKTSVDVTGNGSVDSDDYHFAPYGAATSHACSSTSSRPLWSGNYLNWATTQTLDAFRFALTGGYRHVDTTSYTVLAKTYHAGYGGYAGTSTSGMYPDKVISSGVSGATPFNWTSVQTRIWNGGQRMWFTGTNTAITDSSNPTSHSAAFTGAVTYTGQNSYTTTAADAAAIYEVYVRVRVCDGAVGLEANCTTYGATAAKPEGLIQKYSDKLRYSAVGYLNDSTAPAADRNGGVLRARMKFVGPMKPVWGSSAVSNSAKEWDGTTGVYITSPDSSDVSTTISSAQAQTGWTPTITHSGVINYLNTFGLVTKTYKSYDPVSELYYAGLRYLRNVGNITSYSDLSSATDLNTLNTWIDDFPVIQTWSDPILYSCQKNFVLGIGDVYAWMDGDLPGSTLNNSTVPTDSGVNVKTATDMVGQLEGLSNLGSSYISSSRKNTYYIAGLAYDAHTNDIRSDLTGKQTVSTYWVDVLERQTYESRNQYWLAAKYGGFDVPTGFDPYAATNSNSTLPLASWTTTGDVVISTSTDLRPANYFTGEQADKLIDGLTAAFERIVSEAGDSSSTALSNASPNISSVGSINYQSDYDPAGWTSTLKALSLTYDASDNVTTTTLWEAGALLDARTPASRFIVTSNGSTALEFTSASLSSSAASQYSTFSSVPGVASASQSSSNFLAYLRGDRSQEKSNGGVYRNRSHLLGDIVNSKLTIVAAPSSSYSEASNPGYFAFARSYKSRSTVVYAGANDGMMHAFNGSTSGSDAGKELFAYIPSFVYGTSTTAKTTGLASLGNSKFTHHYFVDSTPIVTDIDFDRTGSSSTGTPDWRSVLIGGLGKGGKGYFAIDVTDPSAWTSQTAVKNKVLWEFSASTMGYSYGNPIVVKTKRWGWVAILTSGYGSSDGKGYIYFVNPKTGALLESISTSSGSLSAPIDFAQLNAFIPDLADYTATELYVGDIQGNLWRVDVSGTGSYSAPLLFATLKDSSGTAQPITTAPRVMIDPSTSKRYVLVGTGRLLDDSDITNSQTQSFYAIIDGTSSAPYKTGTLPSGASFPVTRSQLTANTSPTSGIGSSPTGPMGWYIDLGTDATTGIAERISITPTVNKGIVGFAVNLPNGQVCNPSGSSYIMGLKYNTGQSVVTNASGTLLSKTPSSSKIVTDIAFNNVSGKLRLVAGFNDGSITSVSGSFNSSSSLLRLNWREVPTSQ